MKWQRVYNYISCNCFINIELMLSVIFYEISKEMDFLLSDPISNL
ncbi:Uncharacterised protein [Escherichia coli]|uniref:Uncharacterized protein n=1 Tax=Escherichia coli TaxID=562 RepID=A0A376ZFD8_ECOLX|nr:Uncharacterised protein [Escherichia coli]